MKTVLHIALGHSAFDDRIFFKELVTLSGSYNAYLLVRSAEGLLYDMGRKSRDEGNYNGVGIYAFDDRRSRNFFARASRYLLSRIGFKIRRSYRGLFEKIDELGIKPDVVHLHEPELLEIASRIKKRFGCKVVFDCHEYYYAYYQTSKFDDPRTMKRTGKAMVRMKREMSQCDAIISVTKTMQAVNWFLCPGVTNITIRNSSLLPLVNRDRKPASPIVLVHEGSLSFDRGLVLMLDLFEDSWFRENVRLKIVGEFRGKELEYFDNRCRRTPSLRDCIVCTGWIPYEDLSRYCVGNIGIVFMESFPNTFLGMPNKLFNYIASGMPVISVPLLEINNLVELFDVGVIAQRNSDSIKAATMKIVDSYECYMDRVEKARHAFVWENGDDRKLLELYHDLTSE